MAKITITNNGTFTVELGYSVEEIKAVAAKRPEALRITKEERGEVFEVYQLAVTSKDSLTPYAMSVSKNTIIGAKKAIYTETIASETRDADKLKAAVADRIGTSIVYINAIEDQIAQAIADIAEDTATVLSMISVSGETEAE